MITTNIRLNHSPTAAEYRITGAQRTPADDGFSLQSIAVGTADEAIDVSEFLSPRQILLRLVSGDDLRIGLDGSTYPFRLSGADDFAGFRLDLEGRREISTITAGADTAGSVAGDYVDLTDRSGTVRVWYNIPLKAKGSITYGAPDNTDTVTVAGTVLTKAAAGSATEFSTIAELTALVTAIAGISATDDGTTVSIVADTAGTAGNAITLARAGTGTMSVSGATLTGGTDSSTPPATPGGGRLLQVSTNEGAAATVIATATQLVIHADAEFSATVAAAVVTVTDAHPGTRADVSAGTTGWSVANAQQGAAVQAVHIKSTGTSQVQIGIVPD